MSDPYRSYRSQPDSDPSDFGSPTEAAIAAGLPAPRLWRSRTNRVFAGVLGGLAEKFGLDASALRILYSLLTVFSGGLLIIPYVAIWAITRPHGQRRTAPRVRRSRDKVIAGVLGGLAEKFDMQPNVLRVVYVALSIFSAGFPGILVYLVLWMVMGRPEDPYQEEY